MGHVDEAKRTLATYPPGARLADFAILGSAPPAVYLKMIERDFAAALNLSDAEIADPTENRAAIRVLASNSDAARDEIAGG
jgi:hypothetical protein